MRTLWSDILTDIALGVADATKESQVRKALKRYLMLKAVLIKPVRGGGNRLNRNINLAERLMKAFYNGEEDVVWETALEIEKTRQTKRGLWRKKHRKRNLERELLVGKKREGEAKRRSDRAKLLTNDGELSKAFATMVQRGVAPPTKKIISQLIEKFPHRKNRVSWPDKDRIGELRSLVEQATQGMDVDDCIMDEDDHCKYAVKRNVELMSESLRELQKSVENDFQAVQVQWQDIVKVASRAKKSTGGGYVRLHHGI